MMETATMVSEQFYDREKAEIRAIMVNGFWEGPYVDDKGVFSYLVWHRKG